MGRIWTLVEELNASPVEAGVELARRATLAEPPIAATADPLTAHLDSRLKDLTEPLPVASRILGETVWLVATDRQAAAIQAKGATAYTPEEVAILRDLYAAVKREVWAERLRLIHQVKREFQGRLEA